MAAEKLKPPDTGPRKGVPPEELSKKKPNNLEALEKRARSSRRYVLDIKKEEEYAKETFESLKRGEIPRIDTSKMSQADIAAARQIIAQIKTTDELTWLRQGEIPDVPEVLDVLARIGSAPRSLQDNTQWLIRQGLELQRAQALGLPPEQKILIQQISNRIKQRVIELTGISQEDLHLLRSTGYDFSTLSNITEEQAAVVEVADFYLSEAGSPRRPSRSRPVEEPRPLSERSRWLYDPARDIVPSVPLRTILESLNQRFGDEYNADNLNIAYNALNKAVSEGIATEAEIKKFKEIIETDYQAMRRERFDLTPDIIRRLQDPEQRDELFYERIRTVLNDPNRPSRELMDLYQTNYLNVFLNALANLPDGDKLIAHFGNLKEAIFAFHDLDYYARSAAGDIKSLQQAATYFQNAYAVEALSDPLVVTMKQCYEQALKMIRDNNDGYTPPSLVSYSPKTGENYWDQLARRLFEERVRAGLVYDAAIETKGKNKGFRILDREGRAFKRGKQLTEKDLERQALRVKAAMRMSKGSGILDFRLLEIFAFSKTPGYANPEYGTGELVFSSKAYEGLARWLNPMADWFGKYKMGDTMFAPFFATLIGITPEGAPELFKEFMTWDQHQWHKMIDMAANGELHDWIRQRYGPKAGQLLDAVSELAFSGRFGPLSGWGEHDATIGHTDLDREREGGSMRLFQARSWAEGLAKDRFKETHPSASESDWIKWKNTEEGQHRISEYEKAYKIHVWVQTTMRNPTIVASFVRVPSETYEYRGEHRPKLLRSVIIKEILGDHYDIEANVKSEATPSTGKRVLMERIELLESDVALVQQQALYGGPNNRPRNILPADVGVIRGDRLGVSQAERRRQAAAYIKKAQEYMLGERSSTEWEAALGVRWEGEKLFIDNAHNTTAVLQSISKGQPLLSEELLARVVPMHFGTEDVQWQYLDLEALGERNWFRRTADLQARVEAVSAMTKALDALRPHPELKEIGKALEDIYNAEKGHWPFTAHRLVYFWARSIGEMYRQTLWAKFPFLGKIISRFAPTSIAAQIYGPEHGAAWSANNMREYIDTVQQFTKLPIKDVDAAGNRDPHNIHRLEKELGATRLIAIIEMVGLGFFLAAAATAIAALTKSLEEEKSH